MNITLSIDDEILLSARRLASQRGTSVNQLIRDYLEEIASDLSPADLLAQLEELWAGSPGNSAGRRWTREELHERTGIR